jgi:hypothetical protein
MLDMIEVVQNRPLVAEEEVDDGLLSKEELEQIITHYEQKYQMSSEEFQRHRRDETTPDCFDTMNWGILLKYR